MYLTTADVGVASTPRACDKTVVRGPTLDTGDVAGWSGTGTAAWQAAAGPCAVTVIRSGKSVPSGVGGGGEIDSDTTGQGRWWYVPARHGPRFCQVHGQAVGPDVDRWRLRTHIRAEFERHQRDHQADGDPSGGGGDQAPSGA